MDDAETLKKIALMLLSNLRGTDFDLMVYKAVLHAIAGPKGAPQMDKLLHDARKNPALRKSVLEKYEHLEKGLQQLGQKDGDKAFLDVLKSWKPSGPQN